MGNGFGAQRTAGDSSTLKLLFSMRFHQTYWREGITNGMSAASATLVPACVPSYPESGTPMKTFTLDEAQSLLPLVESLLKRAIEGKRAAEAAEAELGAIAQHIYVAGGVRVDVSKVSKLRSDVESHTQRVRETVAEIDEIGVQVKDLDSGLLDFPCRIDDEVVLLCWRMGETAIEHWHTMDAGFKGRQPVDERFRRRSNSNNRPN